MTVVTAERTRLDALLEQETTLTEQVEQLLEKINTYPQKIKEAREEAIFLKPSKRPLATLNSPLQRLIDAENYDVTKLNGLQADLGAVRHVLRQEDVKVREQETQAARAALELLHGQEKDVWMQAGEILESMATVWNTYVAQVEQSHQFARSNGLESSDALAVIPGPATFEEFLALLLRAATDESVRSEPHTEQLVDSGIYGRRDENGGDIGGATYDTRIVGTRRLETRRRLDEHDILFNVVPDLRTVVRALSLSGPVANFTAE